MAFIHVAKTGGQTIETMLANSFGARYSTAPEWSRQLENETDEFGFVVPKYNSDDVRRLLRKCPWTECIGGHPVTLWSGFDEVVATKWFSMIREPISRGASHFQYNLHDTTAKPRQWDDWVQWPVHHNHQVKMFSPLGKADDAIERIESKNVFVGLTEKFDESLVILKKLMVPDLNISYRRTNTATDNASAREVLADPEKVDQLKRMYSEEILLHEFISKHWYPHFVNEYGPTLKADVEKFREYREINFNKWKYWQSRLNHKLFLKSAF